jgi:hypothetical protein
MLATGTLLPIWHIGIPTMCTSEAAIGTLPQMPLLLSATMLGQTSISIQAYIQ